MMVSEPFKVVYGDGEEIEVVGSNGAYATRNSCVILESSCEKGVYDGRPGYKYHVRCLVCGS